jgi:hypothetical protein
MADKEIFYELDNKDYHIKGVEIDLDRLIITLEEEIELEVTANELVEMLYRERRPRRSQERVEKEVKFEERGRTQHASHEEVKFEEKKREEEDRGVYSAHIPCELEHAYAHAPLTLGEHHPGKKEEFIIDDLDDHVFVHPFEKKEEERGSYPARIACETEKVVEKKEEVVEKKEEREELVKEDGEHVTLEKKEEIVEEVEEKERPLKERLRKRHEERCSDRDRCEGMRAEYVPREDCHERKGCCNKCGEPFEYRSYGGNGLPLILIFR